MALTTPEQRAASKVRQQALRDRDRLALRLKVAGATYADIASQLGWTNGSGAFKAVERQLTALPTPDVESLRQLELNRLDDYAQAIHALALGDPGGPGRAAVAPDLQALDRLLRIHAHRVRLLGLTREPAEDQTERLRALAEEFGEDPDMVLKEAESIAAGMWGRARKRKR